MIHEALQAAESMTSSRSSKYDELFTQDEREQLDAFVTWLVETCEFKSTSASSYRANFSRACKKISEGVELDSDERSALKKFADFSETLDAIDDTLGEDADEALLAELAELDED